MSKRFAVTVALVALANVLAPPHPHAQLIPPKTAFDQLYKDYAGGDYDAITRALPSARSLAVLQAPSDSGKLRKWLGNKWDRTKAVFILEFAGAEAQFAPGAAITALSEGRLFVISRPTPLGQSPEDDAFELAWHNGAMAMLEDRMFVSTQELYLDTIQRRYTPLPGAPAVALDPRFALHRAVAQEQKCWNDQSYIMTTPVLSTVPSKLLPVTSESNHTVWPSTSVWPPSR